MDGLAAFVVLASGLTVTALGLAIGLRIALRGASLISMRERRS